MTGTDEEFTELVDGDFARVDLVGKAANGVPRFLIAKSAEQHGVIPADAVRDLISKADGAVDHEPQEAAVTEVAKAKDLDASEPMADGKGEGDPEEPGSPAWEAIDAATAMKWVAILNRARNAIQLLAGREEIEAFTGVDDGEAAWDLDGAACAIDCAIDVLAPYALGEQAEAEMASEIAKAAATLGESSAIEDIESLAPVVKAGRVLSAGNEARIREAVSSLQQVLSSLPQPPEGVMKDSVTKDAPITSTSPHEETSSSAAPSSASQDGIGDEVNQEHERSATEQSPDGTDHSQEPLGSEKRPVGNAGAEEAQRQASVSKADKSLVAVFNQNGKMIGVVDAEKIQAVGTGDEGDDAPAEEPTPEAPEPEADLSVPAEVAPAAAAAPAATEDPVMKAAVADVVKAALDEQAQQHAAVVKSLEDRITALEAPAPTRILTNGVLPPSDLRGMDNGNGVDVTKSHDSLAEEWSRTVDVAKRAALETQMNEQASAALTALRAQQATR